MYKRQVLSYACQLSQGVAGLRRLLQGGNKNQLDLDISQMKHAGLSNVVDQLQVYVSGTCPTMEGILGAMAADIRRASGNGQERVCIWLHVDEHQLVYDAVQSAFKWDDEDTMLSHKDFLSPAMDVLSSGWCYDNKVFFIPFFTSTDHHCMKELLQPTRYERMCIPLEPLSQKSSLTVLKKSISYEIHSSWLKPLTNDGDLSPADILCREVLNVPRYLKLLGKQVIKGDLKDDYTSMKLFDLLRRIRENEDSLPENCNLLALASICGMKLAEEQWDKLGHREASPYALLEGIGSSTRLMISPAVIARSASNLKLPRPFKEYMCGSVSALALPFLWEKVVAHRFSSVLTVLRELGESTASLGDLLGPHVDTIIDSSQQYELNFKLPNGDGVFQSRASLFSVKERKLSRKTYISPIEEHLKTLVSQVDQRFSGFARRATRKCMRTTDDVVFSMDYKKLAVATFDSQAHPVADIMACSGA